MIQHHFIGQIKHAWQVYVVFNEKYGWNGCWCKPNRTSEAKNSNSKTLECKI